MARFGDVVSTSLSLLLVVLALFLSQAFAQVPQLGVPPYSTVTGSADDVILSNLGIHYTIPEFSRPGRGAPFSFSLNFDGVTWSQAFNTQGVLQWTPSFALTGGGLNGIGAVYYTATPMSCKDANHDDESFTLWQFNSFQDARGTTHSFGQFGLRLDDLQVGGGSCSSWFNNYSHTSGSGVAMDGSAIGITANIVSLSATVTTPHGDIIRPPLLTKNNVGQWTVNGTAPYTLTDSNGNQVSETWQAGTLHFATITDNLGTGAMTASGTYPGNVSYSYTAPSGASAPYTLTFGTHSISTAFSCTGVAEYPATNFSLLDTITLPDSVSTYKFTYTGSGRLKSVQLPSGATISYSYPNGIVCADGTPNQLQRTTIDGLWQYVRSNIVISSGVVTSSTTTVTDPLNNQTAIDFHGGFGIGLFETQRKLYNGGATGTPIEATITCYNGTLPMTSCPTGSTGPALTELDVYRSLDGSAYSRVDTKLSNAQVTEKDEYDFGASTPTRMTTTTYASLANGILDRPSSVVVTDGGAVMKSQSLYTYDEDASSLQPSGALQHTSVTCVPNTLTCRGNLTTLKQYVTGSAFLTKSFTHYDTGQVYVATDVNATTTTSTYGACGNSLLTNATINVTPALSKSYDYYCNGGVVNHSTDENSRQATYTYDDPDYWRPHTISFPDGGSTSYSYNTNSTPWTMTVSQAIDATHTLASFTKYDLMARVQQKQLTSAPDGIIYTDTTYDGRGRLLTQSNPYHTTGDPTYGLTTYTYDAMDRPRMVTKPGGAVSNTTYSMRATQVQDEGNGTSAVTRVFQKDGLGRLASVCEATSVTQLGITPTPAACGLDISGTGFLTSYQYDTLDNLAQVTQGGLNLRSFAYDFLSRLTSATNPESGNTTYAYDAVTKGDMSTRVTPAPNQHGTSTITTTYSYDGLHRLLTKIYSGNTTNLRFAYDQTSAYGITLSNPLGRMTSAWTGPPSGTPLAAQVFSYDVMGRVVDNSQCVSTNCGSASTFRPMPYTYNYLGNEITSPGGWGFNYGYTYDSADRLSAVTSTMVDSNHPGTLLSNPVYNPLGETTSDALGTVGSGITEARSFNSRGEMISFTSNLSGGPSVYSLTNLTYAPNGNLLGATDSVLTGNWTYTYDDFNRLATTTQAAGVAYNYKYDRFGNRWQQNVTAGSGFNVILNFDANNKIIPTNCVPTNTYCYDAMGNLLQDTFHTYAYDAEGRILTVDATGTPTTYAYDAMGRRVQRTKAGVVSYFGYDLAGHSIIEYQTSAAVRFEGYAGSRHLVSYTNGLTYFDFQDAVGSERVHMSQNGASYENTYSLPFGDGQVTSGVGGSTGPTHFTGKELDSESNLHYFGARYYSSTEGRFSSCDPKVITRGRFVDPQEWNMYAYARNSPLAYIDPDGRELKPADIQLAAALTRALKSESVRVALAPYMGKDHDLIVQRGKLGNDPQEPERKETGKTIAEHGGGIKTCSPDCGASSPITLKNATIIIDESVKDGKGKDKLDGVLKHEISHANDNAKDPAGAMKEDEDNNGKKHDDRPQEQRADQFSQEAQKEVDQYQKDESDQQKAEDRDPK